MLERFDMLSREVEGPMKDCTIPCHARALVGSLQRRFFASELRQRLPTLGAAVLLVFLSPFVLLLAPPLTAAVLFLWGLVAVLVGVAQAWLGAAGPARTAVWDELRRLIETNAERVHPPRLAELRARAAVLQPDRPYGALAVTRLLQDLREATGEAWRCRCTD
jgi:hypothetical protein